MGGYEIQEKPSLHRNTLPQDGQQHKRQQIKMLPKEKKELRQNADRNVN